MAVLHCIKIHNAVNIVAKNHVSLPNFEQGGNSIIGNAVSARLTVGRLLYC